MTTRLRQRAALVAIAVVLVTTVLTSAQTSAPASAIVGGHESTSPYSFMGSLQRLDAPRDDLHSCGVSLIAPTWGITAGHCTRSAADVIDEPTSGHPLGWKVRFGSTRVDSGGELVDVVQFVQLNNRYFDRDLALVRLARPVLAEPVAIATGSPKPGTPVRIMGWGQTCHRFTPTCSPDQLQEADTQVQRPKSCRAPEGTLCVGPLDGSVGPENMDSGGPALARGADGSWTLVGSVEGAGFEEPAVYTDIVEYVGWVRKHVSGEVPIPPDTPFPSRALSGTASVGGCSGAVFRSPTSTRSDPAMLLTNGHCVQPRPRPGRSIVGRAHRTPVFIMNARGQTIMRAYTRRLLYATMTGTDVAVYRLDRSYAELRASGVTARRLSARGPERGDAVKLLSATSGRDWTCRVGAVVPGLREGGYAQQDAIRYRNQRGCSSQPGVGPGHGESGSALIDPRTGTIVGVHGTGNDAGLRCRANNPCEIDAQGRVTSTKGRRYGQQTALLRQCLVSGSRIDLSRPGCVLFSPRPTTRRQWAEHDRFPVLAE